MGVRDVFLLRAERVESADLRSGLLGAGEHLRDRKAIESIARTVSRWARIQEAAVDSHHREDTSLALPVPDPLLVFHGGQWCRNHEIAASA